MLKILFLKELRESILSLKFQITFTACGLLALLGSALMVVNCEQEARDHRLLEETHRQMLRAGDANTVQHHMVVDLPLRPWQGLVRGAAGRQDEPVYIHAFFEPYILRPLDSLSANQVYASVDLLFIVTGVMSLLAALLSHDLISREREAGTLRMVMAQSVSRDLVLAAKWLGGFAILLISLGVLLGLTFLLLSALPVEFSLEGEWGRMCGMGAISLLLLSALFSLGLLVSCRCRESVNALVLLLFLWTLFTVVVPSASPHLAAFLAPTPAVEELMYRRLELMLEFDPAGGEKPTLSEEEYQTRLNRLEEDFQQKMAVQAQLTQTLSYLSPVATGAHLMADLAGTGLKARSRTVRAVREFREEFVEFVDELKDPVPFAQVPRLRPPYPDFREAVGSLRPGLTVLVLYNVLFFLGAHLAFLRQDLTS